MNNRAIIFFKVVAALVFCTLLTATLSSCISIRYVGYKGSGDIVTEERTISGVESVSVSAGMNLHIQQTGTETLKIEAQDNILPLITTEVSDGSLTIRYKSIILGGMATRGPVNIYLTVKDLNEIRLSSGSRLESQLIETQNLAVNLSSGSRGSIEVDAKELTVRLSSGSDLRASGTTAYQDINLSSGSRYEADDLISSTAKVNSSSGAAATINVADSLDVNISSGASARYYGSPRVTSNVTSGGFLESISKD